MWRRPAARNHGFGRKKSGSIGCADQPDRRRPHASDNAIIVYRVHPERHGRIRAVKRDIARIYTVIRERELGIRATPVAVEAPVKAAKKTTKKTDATAKAEAEVTDETKEA